MIEKYIKDLCELLDIPVPEISHDTENFPTKTMLAQYSTAENKIRITKFVQPTPDLMFAIAHELRHAWQKKYCPELFEGYKQSNELSLEEYNMQEIELDAHAFGFVIMEKYFNLTAQFYGFSEPLKEKIYERAREIAKEL